MLKSKELKFDAEPPWLNNIAPSNAKDVPKMQLQAAFLRTRLDHSCSLSVKSETCSDNMTSAACKIGHASSDPEILLEMMDIGMNIAVVTRESDEPILETITHIREACAKYSKKLRFAYPLAIGIKTMGHTVYTGNHEIPENKIVLSKEDIVRVTTDEKYKDKCTKDTIFIDSPGLANKIKKGDRIYLRTRSISLEVKEIDAEGVMCSVASGGRLLPKSVAILPDSLLNDAPLTDEDRKDIEIAVEQELDIIFISHTRTAEKITKVREIIGRRGERMRIVADIEDEMGINNVEEILKVADGIVIARNSLSISLSQSKVFVAQKILIAKCNQARKPVVIASQFLKSMYDKPRATRPEISDVAHAVMDGADCLLLNDETATGNFPVLALKTMVDICKEAEGAIWQTQTHGDLDAATVPPTDPLTAIALAAVEASLLSTAAAIIVVTSAPKSGQEISSFRPRCPIIAVTRYPSVARKLQLYKSLYPVVYSEKPRRDWSQDADARFQFGLAYAKSRGFVTSGDAVIFVSGWHHGNGFTNTIRIVYVAVPT